MASFSVCNAVRRLAQATATYSAPNIPGTPLRLPNSRQRR
ncbi:TPA: hypothetical protein N0F65_001555 [Lagenidium giganteum]|uniref:Uncharacterized protein n=1 Tax=Lagenidium giganteum TaxID=4803 RepID=A0AAV2YHA7_9STRA|nr:TPA: hypothetical protein N0F65_001555 [Lagenidium giganteum]